jgi:hypothetical protein
MTDTTYTHIPRYWCVDPRHAGASALIESGDNEHAPEAAPDYTAETATPKAWVSVDGTEWRHTTCLLSPESRPVTDDERKNLMSRLPVLPTVTMGFDEWRNSPRKEGRSDMSVIGQTAMTKALGLLDSHHLRNHHEEMKGTVDYLAEKGASLTTRRTRNMWNNYSGWASDVVLVSLAKSHSHIGWTKS